MPCIIVSCNLSKSSGTRTEPEKTDCAWAVLSDLMSANKLSFGLIFEKAAIVLLSLVYRLLLHYDFFLYLDRGGRNLLNLDVITELLCATLIFSYMSDRLSAGQPAYETQLHAPRLRTGNNGGEVQK